MTSTPCRWRDWRGAPIQWCGVRVWQRSACSSRSMSVSEICGSTRRPDTSVSSSYASSTSSLAQFLTCSEGSWQITPWTDLLASWRSSRRHASAFAAVSQWLNRPASRGHSSSSAGNSTGRAMQFDRDFKEFLECLAGRDVRYLVVGGYAVAAHGHPRYTGDLDLWFWTAAENPESLLTALDDFGFADGGAAAAQARRRGAAPYPGRSRTSCRATPTTLCDPARRGRRRVESPHRRLPDCVRDQGRTTADPRPAARAPARGLRIPLTAPF